MIGLSGSGDGASGRLALLVFLCLLVAGCPAPIPHCTERRTYLPGIVIGNPDDATVGKAATVIGSIALDPPIAKSLVSIRLVRLDGDVIVAATEADLPPDGRISWTLAPGRYAISGMQVMSDYADGSYRTHRLLSPHLRFEAQGAGYIGHARIVTDPGEGPMPAHLFPAGAARQWILGIREIAITADPRLAPSSPPAALARADLRRNPMRWHPVEAYATRPKDACAKWSYVAWCFGFYCV